MRLLHIHSGNLYGGVETVLRTMALSCSLVNRLTMEFALSFEGRIADELRAAECRVHILGPIRASQPFSVIRARARLAAICRAESFDATVAHSPWTLAMLAPAATRPLVYYQHDRLTGRHWTERFSRRSHPDLILANSSFAAGTTAKTFPGMPVTVVRPPTELPTNANRSTDRQSVRSRFGVPEGSLVVLQAARFEAWKGHALLLEALHALRSNPDWFLWIAGEAQRPSEKQLRQDLENHARELGIHERVAFLGHISDMPALMNGADIYCQPNTSPEPFGLTFIEALHAELPVVATNLGGAKEILAPDYGMLAEPTVDSLSAALSFMILGSELRAALARRGPLRARTLCDPRTQMEAFTRAIASLREDRVAA